MLERVSGIIFVCLPGLEKTAYSVHVMERNEKLLWRQINEPSKQP
jgi:hypothetical protein